MKANNFIPTALKGGIHMQPDSEDHLIGHLESVRK